MAFDIEHILTRGVAQVIDPTELRQKLASGKPLRVKLGIDPTGSDITFGHAAVFRKLRQFQDLGHTAVAIIGDWTARIGDPSGRTESRPMLSPDQVRVHATHYLEQIYKIVDRNRTEVRWQSEWYDNFDLQQVIRLAGQRTVARTLEREDFANRYRSGIEITLAEFLYPLLQGYDSVAVQADVELGGTDQTFNLLVGRDLQERYGQSRQQIMTLQILVGLDGKMKMGKSLNNYIAISEPAKDIYGKVMSLPDEAMRAYFDALTDIPTPEIAQLYEQMTEATLNPRDVKRRLARELAGQFNGAQAAAAAEEAFIAQFERKQLPADIPSYELHCGEAVQLIALLVEAKLAGSKGEARRLIEQGGVRINDQKVTVTHYSLVSEDGLVLQAGKLKFIKLKCT